MGCPTGCAGGNRLSSQGSRLVDRSKVAGWAPRFKGPAVDTANPIVLPADGGTARMVRVYNVLRVLPQMPVTRTQSGAVVNETKTYAGLEELKLQAGMMVAVECSYPQHNVLVTIGGLQCVGQVEHGQVKPIVQAVGHDGGNWLMTLQAAKHVGWVD